jgi:hypothetical protein
VVVDLKPYIKEFEEYAESGAHPLIAKVDETL